MAFKPSGSKLELSKCKTFYDFWLHVASASDTRAQAFPKALVLVNSMPEAMRLLWASQSLEYSQIELAFNKVMEYIVDDDTLEDFKEGFNLINFSWMFGHRDLIMRICDKHEQFN